LIHVRAFTRDNNVSVEFDPFGFSIKDLPTPTEMLQCNSAGSLYPFWPPPAQALLSSSSTSADLWHRRLGHPGHDTFNRTVRQFEFQCTKTMDHSCRSCQLGKHTRLPFQTSESIAFVPFQLVHGDIWTSSVSSNTGFKYYLVLIDACTHYVWTFPLRDKSEVCLLHFHAYVLTQFQLPPIAFQTDNGKEFDNTAVRQHFAAHGISLRLSCPYTSAQNGKAERIIRTLNDCVRSLLVHAHMPFSYWVEALATATHLLNRCSCHATHPL
jgi:histone deacetylase 1/2